MISNRLAVIAITSTLLPAGATAAMAADVAVAPGPTWTGCYAGANLGYAHGDNEAFDAPFRVGPFAGTGTSWNTPPGAAFERTKADASSAIGGVELGCDYAIALGSAFVVVGAAADISLLGLSGNGTSAIAPDTRTSFDVDWAGTVRGRLGVAPSANLLIYATGGYASADIGVRAFDLSAVPTPGVMDVSGGGTESGWMVGGGAEWRFAPNWTVSVEYLHFRFDDLVATGPAIFPPGAFPLFESELDIDTVRVGLKWRM